MAVKVQHEGAESLMRQDIGNSLVICRALSALGVDMYVDQVSVLEEYRAVVPAEFDFVREKRLLDLIRESLKGNVPPGTSADGKPAAALPCPARVTLPDSIASHSCLKVLTETFVEGVGLSKLQRELDLHEASWDIAPPPFASPAEMTRVVTHLLEAFGHMIFTLGAPSPAPSPNANAQCQCAMKVSRCQLVALRFRRPSLAPVCLSALVASLYSASCLPSICLWVSSS